MFEHSYQRSVRVMAPIRELYHQLDSVAGVIRFIPHLHTHPTSTSDGDGAGDGAGDGCVGSMVFAALPHQLPAHIVVERIDPPHVLRIRLRVRRPHLDIAGRFDLRSCARTETTLRYTAQLSTPHPPRRRTTLIDVLEDHVSATTELIALRARQYTQAEHHLLRLTPGYRAQGWR